MSGTESTRTTTAVHVVDRELLSSATRGDTSAFDRLFRAHVPKLRGLLARMVGHQDDVDDLVQQALLQAFERLSAFRAESSPGTWLCAIGVRLAVDHLRRRKRWRERAQTIFAAQCLETPDLQTGVGRVISDPSFTFDANEHVGYCFTCIGRTLDPQLQAALVLRDVLEMTNEEAAKALGLSRSAFRHRLAEARQRMQVTFEGLCALTNKDGICWQCQGLRDAMPEDKRGPVPPTGLNWGRRLQVVRDTALSSGGCQQLHALFFTETERQEEEGRGDSAATTDCGRRDSE